MSQTFPIVIPKAEGKLSSPSALVCGQTGPVRGLLRSALPLVLGAGLLSLVINYSMHLTNLRMHQAGMTNFEIGVSVGLQGLGIFLFAQLALRLTTTTGVRIATLLGATLCALAALGVAYAQTFLEWAIVRLIFASGIALLLTGTEFLVLRRCNPGNRVLIIGAYATSLALGSTIGSCLLSILGTTSVAPIAIMLALFSAAAAPALLLSRAPSRDHILPPASALTVLKVAPVTFGAVFVFGMLDTGILALVPVYAAQSHYSASSAASLGLAAAIGAVAVQYHLLRFAGQRGVLLALRFCSVAQVFVLAVLPFAIGSPLWALGTCFALGALVEGLYTLALIHLAQRFEGASLSMANAVFISICALGEVIGPCITGSAMDALGANGMVLVGILMAGSLLVVINGRKLIGRSPRLQIANEGAVA